ncbi:hypothetical protein LTR37_010290 [Vermiconidia calcicola]|uniref:Uncharacterized protein n=1 Tax=Vermiconidia calcicola TaxID=1690605 RepID=A0ACC3N5C5_9PEZI|nr:hypothetical protein LTR37_010290 [Vermiconidia calcicola]
MSEIYPRAEKVIVWLGKGDSSSENVMRMIPELATTMSEIQDLQSVNYETARCHIRSAVRDSFNLGRSSQLAQSRLVQTPLGVLQEACLAKEILFLCGSEQLDFVHPAHLATFIRKSRIVAGTEEDHKLPPGLESLDSLVDYKTYLHHDYDVGLVLLLNLTRSLRCRNIVDRVYGTLGLLHPRTRERITVDYSQEDLNHPAKLFTQAGKLMLEENGPFNRFTLFWFMSKPHMLDTPSWLPGHMYPIEGQALCMERAGWPKDPTSPYYEARISTSLSIPAVSLKHLDNIQIDGTIIDQEADVVHSTGNGHAMAVPTRM